MYIYFIIDIKNIKVLSAHLHKKEAEGSLRKQGLKRYVMKDARTFSYIWSEGFGPKSRQCLVVQRVLLVGLDRKTTKYIKAITQKII